MKRERVLVCVRVLVSLAMALVIFEGLAHAQCSTQFGGVVLCSGKKSMSFFVGSCPASGNLLAYQVSSDFMNTWGPIETLDLSNTSMNLAVDHQWEGLFSVRFRDRTYIIAPCWGIDTSSRPLVLLMTSTNCGETWTTHEINVPIPDGLTFLGSIGCPELNVSIQQDGYFAIVGTVKFWDGTQQKGYGWVVSSRNGEDWTVSLTMNGMLPTNCID